MRDVRLHNICSLELEQFTILMWRMQTLAGGDRNTERGHSLCDFLQDAQILRRYGLLNPAWAERCEGISHRARSHSVEPSVHFNEDFRIGTNCIANRLYQFDGTTRIGA